MVAREKAGEKFMNRLGPSLRTNELHRLHTRSHKKIVNLRSLVTLNVLKRGKLTNFNVIFLVMDSNF